MPLGFLPYSSCVGGNGALTESLVILVLWEGCLPEPPGLVFGFVLGVNDRLLNTVYLHSKRTYQDEHHPCAVRGCLNFVLLSVTQQGTAVCCLAAVVCAAQHGTCAMAYRRLSAGTQGFVMGCGMCTRHCQTATCRTLCNFAARHALCLNSAEDCLCTAELQPCSTTVLCCLQNSSMQEYKHKSTSNLACNCMET